MRTRTFTFRKLARVASMALLTAISTAAQAHKGHNGHKQDMALAGTFIQTNLVSDQAGVAQLQDTNLVNAWGVSLNPTGPFWISDNGSGLSTLYAVTNDSSGPHVNQLGLKVIIPGEGNPTGQVFNNTTNFNGDAFIFVSEDGTISGWRFALGTNAEVLATRTNAVYKGVTLASVSGVPFLLAANFAEATVDVYDGNLNLVGQLADPRAPDGYAPFNVQSIHGFIFVTFAKQDSARHDDDPGPGHGLVDVLDLRHGRFLRFATGTDAGGHLAAINSPWGVALAPQSFGRCGDRLLIGNFGSGTIMTFSPFGFFRGFLESSPGNPLVIDGLWALTFGNGGSAGVPGTLYFTAGPDSEGHGLFGSLQPAGNGHHDNDGDDDADDN